MAKRIALVLKTFDNGTAEVMTDKKSGCSGCQDTRHCESCLSGSDKIVAVVNNDACACKGDVVEIRHGTNAILGSAALFYVVPVFGLLAGAFIGGAAAGSWGLDESLGALLAGVAGLAIALAAVIGFTRTEFGRHRLVPHIVGVFGGKASDGSRTIAPSVSAAGKRSCCTG
jgi:sigma-E factor negative regulatory protein RseC